MYTVLLVIHYHCLVMQLYHPGLAFMLHLELVSLTLGYVV